MRHIHQFPTLRISEQNTFFTLSGDISVHDYLGEVGFGLVGGGGEGSAFYGFGADIFTGVV